uniref:Glutathione S-transferase 4 n=1 Tax=Ascaris suum TaxID=6253 RepID=F1LEC7_ASCSU
MQLNFFLPRFKLYDFADRNNADITRMIFRVANVPYEEVLIDRDGEWQQLQREMPLGTLPVLEIDGHKIGGTTAICRQLAWRFGLSGETAADDSVVDMLADFLHEAHISLKSWINAIHNVNNSEQDVESLDKMANHYVNTRLGPVLEKHLEKNGTGFLVGGKITWADLMAISFFNTLFDNGREDFISAFPLIKQHYQQIAPIVLPLKKFNDELKEGALPIALSA